MSEANKYTEEQQEELKSLKQRADQMSISYSPNIGLDTLRERVNGTLNGSTKEEKPTVSPARRPGNKQPLTEQQKKNMLSTRLRKESMKLVRVVVQCMNPNKRDSDGEIFTIGNAVIGTVKKFVPFNIEAGYHVPHIIYEMMRDRKYQHFVKKKLPNGQIQMKSVISPEFNVRVLDPLTPKEMENLAKRQALNHSIDDEG